MPKFISLLPSDPAAFRDISAEFVRHRQAEEMLVTGKARHEHAFHIFELMVYEAYRLEGRPIELVSTLVH